MKNKAKAMGLVAAAAMIWSLDSIFRFTSLESFNPFAVVFLEHFFGLLFLLLFFFKSFRRQIPKIKKNQILAIITVGMVGSAVGGVFYSESLKYIGPSTTNIFPMTEPFFVLVLAYFFLKEKGSIGFFQWALWMLLGTLAICLPDISFGFVNQNKTMFWTAVLFGMLASLMWGLSTVAGKWLLKFYSPWEVVCFRWAMAVVGLGAIMLTKGIAFDFKMLFSWQPLGIIVFLSTAVGILPMWLYYRGLQVLPASVATFVELLYPLFGIFLPVLIYGHSLSELQWLGGMAVLFGIILLLFLELEFSN